MQIKVEVMSADKTSPVVQKGESIPCPIMWTEGMTVRALQEAMATAAWSIGRVYGLANPQRECRSVVFSFDFPSYTGKPSSVKD